MQQSEKRNRRDAVGAKELLRVLGAAPPSDRWLMLAVMLGSAMLLGVAATIHLVAP